MATNVKQLGLFVIQLLNINKQILWIQFHILQIEKNQMKRSYHGVCIGL